MKFLIKKNLAPIFATLCLGVVLFVFQNCGRSGNSGSSKNASSNGISTFDNTPQKTYYYLDVGGCSQSGCNYVQDGLGAGAMIVEKSGDNFDVTYYLGQWHNNHYGFRHMHLKLKKLESGYRLISFDSQTPDCFPTPSSFQVDFLQGMNSNGILRRYNANEYPENDILHTFEYYRVLDLLRCP